jgi:hypothetical protein
VLVQPTVKSMSRVRRLAPAVTGNVEIPESLRLIGVVETVRGLLAVMGKQFKVANAKITFTGGVPISLPITRRSGISSMCSLAALQAKLR